MVMAYIPPEQSARVGTAPDQNNPAIAYLMRLLSGPPGSVRNQLAPQIAARMQMPSVGAPPGPGAPGTPLGGPLPPPLTPLPSPGAGGGNAPVLPPGLANFDPATPELSAFENPSAAPPALPPGMENFAPATPELTPHELRLPPGMENFAPATPELTPHELRLPPGMENFVPSDAGPPLQNPEGPSLEAPEGPPLAPEGAAGFRLPSGFGDAPNPAIAAARRARSAPAALDGVPIPLEKPPATFGDQMAVQTELDKAAKADPQASPESLAQQTIKKLLATADDKNAPWMALARAGFSMAASRNPTFFGAMGEGGLAGVEALTADDRKKREALAQAAALDLQEQTRINQAQHYKDQAAAQLRQDERDRERIKLEDRRIGLTAQQLAQQSAHQAAQLDIQRQQLEPADARMFDAIEKRMNRAAAEEWLSNRFRAPKTELYINADGENAVMDRDGTLIHPTTREPVEDPSGYYLARGSARPKSAEGQQYVNQAGEIVVVRPSGEAVYGDGTPVPKEGQAGLRPLAKAAQLDMSAQKLALDARALDIRQRSGESREEYQRRVLELKETADAKKAELAERTIDVKQQAGESLAEYRNRLLASKENATASGGKLPAKIALAKFMVDSGYSATEAEALDSLLKGVNTEAVYARAYMNRLAHLERINKDAMPREKRTQAQMEQQAREDTAGAFSRAASVASRSTPPTKAAPTPAPSRAIPPRPANVPPGSQYSPSTNTWWKDGKRVG